MCACSFSKADTLAAQISQRTMEIFRTVGIEQIVRQKSGEQFVQDGAIMAVGPRRDVHRLPASVEAG